MRRYFFENIFLQKIQNFPASAQNLGKKVFFGK